MKRLTVAAAALAAGLLTIVSHSQAESDRFLLRPTPTAKAGATGPAKTAETSKVSDKKTKVKAASANLGRVTAKGTKRRSIRIDMQQTASLVHAGPELKATASKTVKVFSDKVETGIALDTGIANAMSYT